MYPTGSIVYTSKNLEGIGYIFYPFTKVSKSKQIYDMSINSIKYIKMLKYLSIKELRYFIKSINSNSSLWIEEFINTDFIHIDLVVVNEGYKGMGFAKQIINEVLKIADEKNLPTTLETQNPINVEIYKHLGFEVVKEQKYEKLIQYCMIRRPNV